MTVPHQDNFPFRRAILIWVSVLCVLIAAAWPGQSIGARMTDIGVAILSFALCYAASRLILSGLVTVAQNQFGRLPLWIMLLVFYGGILATVSGLLTAPFQWNDVHASGASAPSILAALPSGLYTAAAALHVLATYNPDND